MHALACLEADRARHAARGLCAHGGASGPRGQPVAGAVPAAAPNQASPPTQGAKPSNPELILATTTSTQDSGLLDVLVPLFERATRLPGQDRSPSGPGRRWRWASAREADVVLVHAPEAEQVWMAAGNGTQRLLVMHNDFVVVGPADDPAAIARRRRRRWRRCSASPHARAPFVCRGDNSGTHMLEQQLWQRAGLAPAGQAWYLEVGSGHGPDAERRRRAPRLHASPTAAPGSRAGAASTCRSWSRATPGC